MKASNLCSSCSKIIRICSFNILFRVSILGTLLSPENIVTNKSETDLHSWGFERERLPVSNGVNMYLRTIVIRLTKDLQRALQEDLINRENLFMLGGSLGR